MAAAIRKILFLLLIVGFVFTSGCTSQPAGKSEEAEAGQAGEASLPPPTDTPDAQQTAAAQAALAAQTQSAQATLSSQATESAKATKAQEAANRQATMTQSAVEEATQTAVQQTAQAEVMVDLVASLIDQGIVDSSAGSYKRLEDFENEWAQIDWFSRHSSGESPENFAIRADLTYASASEHANWPGAGCGFTFGEAVPRVFYLALITLESNANLQYWSTGSGKWIAQRPVKRLEVPEGGFEITLVVFHERATIFVNGDKVLSEHVGNYKPGELSYALASGTNEGYGTRCEMKNVDFWAFE